MSLTRETLKPQMPQLVAEHVPSNARRFSWILFNGKPNINSTLGLALDPEPFEGKVAVLTDELIVVKRKRTEFAVLDRTLVTTVPHVGDTVVVTPYIRRRFDGQRADRPEKNVMLIGEAPAKLPVPEPKCPELAELIQQLEQLPAPDGFRRITHMLVDAHAKDFTWTDPDDENIISDPPAINFTVATQKFDGQVSIVYDRGADAYVIELRREGSLVKRVEDIYFDMLGEVLEQWIDDGTWRRIEVVVTKAKATGTRKVSTT